MPIFRSIPYFCLLSLVCATLQSGSCLASENLVKNGDFSEGALLPDSWTFSVGARKLWDTGEVLDQVSYEAEGGVDNGRCLLVKSTSGDLMMDQRNSERVLEPGTYKLSASIKSEGFSDGAPRLAVVNVPFDKWNGYIDIKPHTEKDGSGGWITVEVIFEQKEAQKGFRINFLSRGANGSIWLDDIKLEKDEE